MLVSEERPWFHTETKPSEHYGLLFVTLAPLSCEKQAILCCFFPIITLLIQILSSIQLCQCFLSISSMSGLYRLAGVCANLYETAVHQSWVVMATPGQKFYAVTSILQTISCVSLPSLTALVKQGGVEVRNWLHRHIFLSGLHWTNYSISGLTISAPQASCRDCELEEASSSKDTLDTFCRSDFGEYLHSYI